MRHALEAAVLTALAIFAGAACIPMAVFNGPEVVPAGATVSGPATSMAEAVSGGAAPAAGGPEIVARHGVGHGVDIGLRASGIPPFGTLYADARWQFLEAPLPATAGLGGSFTVLNVREQTSDSATSPFGAIYPSVAVGTNRLWAALRGMVFIGAPTRDLEDEALIGIHAGTSFGDVLRLMPVAFFYAGAQPIAGAGVALQYTIGGNDGG